MINKTAIITLICTAVVSCVGGFYAAEWDDAAQLKQARNIAQTILAERNLKYADFFGPQVDKAEKWNVFTKHSWISKNNDPNLLLEVSVSGGLACLYEVTSDRLNRILCREH